MKTAVIILAAGESSRLGKPKQLLPFRGRTFLAHAIVTASAVGPVFVVLGARIDEIRPVVTDATIVENSEWAEGMGSSIRAGVAALPAEVTGAILMTCDQPLITAEFLKRLASSGPLAAAEYNNTIGVPAYFSREFFGELLDLKEKAGAKSVLLAHSEKVMPLPCPEAARDIDTLEDYRSLTSSV